MHDHGSPANSLKSDISSPQEIRSLDISSMMSETKQLHSTYPLSHHFQLHQQEPSLSQTLLHSTHSHHHESLLYEYMCSQQQQHRINEQQYVHQTSSEQQTLLNSVQMQQHILQQQQQQHHQQHQHQQQMSYQYREQCENQGTPHSLQQTELQEERNQLEHLKQTIPNLQVRQDPVSTSDETTRGTPGDSASFQDMDDVDDDILDDEEEEDLRMYYEQCKQTLLQKHPNVASELLTFAETASMDIQKFFGRTKGEEDACDVYEDKWAATKSGRELYYADLIRIAQGGDTEPSSSSKSKKGTSFSSTRVSPSTPSSSASYTSSLSPLGTDILDSRTRYSGRRDDSIGMGALSDLFEYGLPELSSNQVTRNKPPSSSRTRNPSAQRSRVCGNRITPKMRERSFPKSFWKEPTYNISVGCGMNTLTNMDNPHMIPPMSNSKLPDFSDLMESWQGSVEALVNNGHSRDLVVESALEHQQ
ncbi:hypothetical protein EGW08_010480 [Elysia chlorotica]|uniref:Uncharacterized protein n=1 Tax=Elysia chlorotica TaxID=188477 RepID=A0A3S1B7Q6_ELYCH|nr:hypothetical protein EGW08_010480 [Elysia chlorotica]